MNTIASLVDTATQMGQTAKLLRLLAEMGVTPQHLQRAIDSKSARTNLADFLQSDCPKVDYTQPVPKAKREGKSGQSTTLVNPAEFFVSSPKFNVDSDLGCNIDLSPVPDDARELMCLFTLPNNMKDSAVQGQIGGKEYAKRTTLPQLMRECKRGLMGEPTLFQVGQYYLLYLEGKVGALYPVHVYWYDGQLHVNCYCFVQDGYWVQGRVVCGNDLFCN